MLSLYAIRRLCHIFDEAHLSHADFLYEDNPDWKKYMYVLSGLIDTYI